MRTATEIAALQMATTQRALESAYYDKLLGQQAMQNYYQSQLANAMQSDVARMFGMPQGEPWLTPPFVPSKGGK